MILETKNFIVFDGPATTSYSHQGLYVPPKTHGDQENRQGGWICVHNPFRFVFFVSVSASRREQNQVV